MSITVLALDRNEYYFRHHPQVLDVFFSLKEQSFSVYAPYAEHTLLLNRLAQLLQIDSHRITLTHGAEDALVKALSWLKSKYRSVVVEDFCWANYNHIADGFGYSVHKVQCNKTREGFSLNLQALKKHLDTCEPSLVLLTSPNNPTGHSISQSDLYSLIRIYPKHFFLLDMVYAPFFDRSYCALLSNENSLFVGSFSKFFGLPGLRVGFVIGYLPKAFQLNLGLQPQAIQVCHTVLEHIDWYQCNRNIMIEFAQYISQKKYKNIIVYKSDAPFFIVMLSLSRNLYEILEQAEKECLVRPKFILKDNISYIRFGLGPIDVCKKIENYLTFIDDKFDST